MIRDQDPFSSGFLVHGKGLDRLPGLLENGIRTGRYYLGEEGTPTPDDICFSILPKLPREERYTKSSHHGPKNALSSRSRIAIIVSPEDLQREIASAKLVAVGENFWNPRLRPKVESLYDFEGPTVCGMQIIPEVDRHCPDEVRLMATDPLNTKILPHLWRAVVIRNEHLGQLRNLVGQQASHHTIPVINPAGELLAQNLLALEDS